MSNQTQGSTRETFASRFGLLMTMIGVAVGLGAVWRFPYMVGRFGGAAFVLFYMAVVFFIGIPALMIGQADASLLIAELEAAAPAGSAIAYTAYGDDDELVAMVDGGGIMRA